MSDHGFSDVCRPRRPGRGQRALSGALAALTVGVFASPAHARTDALRERPTRQVPEQRQQLEKTLFLADDAARVTPAQIEQLTAEARVALQDGHWRREGLLFPNETQWLTVILDNPGSKESIAEHTRQVAIAYHARHGGSLSDQPQRMFIRRLAMLEQQLRDCADVVGQRRVVLLLNLDDLLTPAALATVETESGPLQLFAKGGKPLPEEDRPESINLTLTAAWASPEGLRTILQHEIDNLEAGRYVDNETTEAAQHFAREALQAHQVSVDTQASTDRVVVHKPHTAPPIETVETDPMPVLFDRLAGLRSIPAAQHLTAGDRAAFFAWLAGPQQRMDLPPADLLKKLLVHLQHLQVHALGGDARKPTLVQWRQLLADRWHVSPQHVELLLGWFDGLTGRLADASVGRLDTFIRAYLSNYHRNPGLKKRFLYVTDPTQTLDQQLSDALQHIDYMHRQFSEGFLRGESILKAPVPETPYFLGIRAGLGESTFGYEVLFGNERPSATPLSGVFFRIGLDTAGPKALRNVRIGGVRGQEPEIQLFWDAMGMAPSTALLLVALELAEQHGFSDFIGLDERHHPKASTITLSYRQIYRQFGLRSRHPLGLVQSVPELEERWQRRAQDSEAVGRSRRLLHDSVSGLDEMPSLGSATPQDSSGP